MGILDSVKTVITPKSTRAADDQAIEREISAMNQAEALAKQAADSVQRSESVVSPISAPDSQGVSKGDFKLEDYNFSNFDFNVDGGVLYAMQNMQKLSSNEVDVYVDPRALFEKTMSMYPADQVTFSPALFTLRDNAAGCGTDIINQFEMVYGENTPIVGVVIRAHCSDLFKGSTKLSVKTPFVDITTSIDDVKNPGVLSVLFGSVRKNVNIQSEIEEGVLTPTVEYTPRDRTCFVDFPTEVATKEFVVSGDNVWLEVFPIVGTSMLRKVILADIASHNVKLLPAQLITLI